MSDHFLLKKLAENKIKLPESIVWGKKYSISELPEDTANVVLYYPKSPDGYVHTVTAKVKTGCRLPPYFVGGYKKEYMQPTHFMYLPE
jgi:hypothetical protein